MNKLNQSIEQSFEELEIDGDTLSNAIFLIRNNIWWLLMEDVKDSNLIDAKNYISYLMKDRQISLEDIEKIKSKMLISDSYEIQVIQDFYDQAYVIESVFLDKQSRYNWQEYIEKWNIQWTLRYVEKWVTYMFCLPDFHNLTSENISQLLSIIDESEYSDYEFEVENMYDQSVIIH